ncbi:hypothetical protein B0H12DRAFT_829267 [Mycena haematopus]|nr:hypothetical protein B0H12DRAFT_829267 [Mycena haematopus]
MFLYSFQQYPFAFMGGGWNLKNYPMTIRTFYRWLDIIDDHYRDRNINFQLQKVNLKRFNVLRYVVDSFEGPLLPRDSDELLEAAVYGPVLDGQPYREKVGDRFCVGTLRAFEKAAGCFGEDVGEDLNRHNKMPQAIIDAVTQRDCGLCCVTARSDLPTSIIWVCPPAVAYRSYAIRDADKENLHEAYRTAENAITLCDALITPFMENMFSIDIEDAGRIINFGDLPIEVPNAHLPRNSASHMFWYLHFKWTLRVHFHGGDIAFEQQSPNPQELMDELGDDCADLHDLKWHSGVGAEVLAEFLEQQLCIKQADFNDDSDGMDTGDGDGGDDMLFNSDDDSG